MLLTVQEEAHRQEVVMPSPERLHKVKKSMAMIKVVLDERVSMFIWLTNYTAICKLPLIVIYSSRLCTFVTFTFD